MEKKEFTLKQNQQSKKKQKNCRVKNKQREISKTKNTRELKPWLLNCYVVIELTKKHERSATKPSFPCVVSNFISCTWKIGTRSSHFLFCSYWYLLFHVVGIVTCLRTKEKFGSWHPSSPFQFSWIAKLRRKMQPFFSECM